jgi:hypothetical protein
MLMMMQLPPIRKINSAMSVVVLRIPKDAVKTTQIKRNSSKPVRMERL